MKYVRLKFTLTGECYMDVPLELYPDTTPEGIVRSEFENWSKFPDAFIEMIQDRGNISLNVKIIEFFEKGE